MEVPEDLREGWEERAAIMVYDGRRPPTEAAGLAVASLPLPGEEW